MPKILSSKCTLECVDAYDYVEAHAKAFLMIREIFSRNMLAMHIDI